MNTNYLKKGDYPTTANEVAVLDSSKSTKTLSKNQSPESNNPFVKLSAKLNPRDPGTPTRK